MLFTVRQARTYWGKTQREAAIVLGLSERTYCRYEDDPTIMPSGILDRLAKATGIPLGQFVIFSPKETEEGGS